MATGKSEEIVSEEIKVCLEERYKQDAQRARDPHLSKVQSDNPASEPKKAKKKITIEVDEDDPCLKQGEAVAPPKRFPGGDPRFQQQNQTLRCWVMYTDFYRCEHILGENADACGWFKQVYTSICPNAWITRFDELRTEGKFAWHKQRIQGEFPGDKYGV